ncbi:MFS transporter [Actinacidiphila sp. ITFR-21]|uniref:MFS transporter n=1 Tax=Actinacidiphila sp. ITFR-21 TaxID=3075199 RepID=UPI00288B20B2|nr:MFS transporter [Streptomyces sp. ITFR-21]WNI18460.1 MFS transporter [Streptomyces sp. ITFR-21]
MTQPLAAVRRPPPPAVRRRAVAGALTAAFGGFASFNLLLSAVPAYAVRTGAGPVGAGAVTGTMMAATLAVQPLTPRLFARLGRRRSLALSGALLGLPCLLMLLPAVSGLVPLLGLTTLRGLGFGVFVVAGVTFTAELFPPDARGRAVGWYGGAVGAAGILGAPLGLTLARHGAYPADFAAAAAGAALVLAGSLGFPREPVAPPAGRRRPPGAVLLALRPLAGPLLVEGATTTAYGVVFTFLPLTASAAPAALLAVQAAAVLARLVSGRLVDRYGGRPVLGPAVLCAALGAAAGAVPHHPAVVLAGGALFGAGFGAVQNATLVLVMRAAGDTPAGLGLAGVSWNIAFDAGTGFGALAGGPLLSLGGPAALFPATAAVLAATLLAGGPTDR